ncbi:glycine--tRNA ligase subunit beta [Sphingosinicella ginsenosidimutans]|uniref:Glycine--tRNA ligase beta subunit n=1 Tax=Allosphingosinicella ginsenosidimutans TaxID=1176539 RepID=A0A5C6TPV0_9SPHN|nr:glycine--tRNA ligase subunit beta [Sphingosinicella ginsenosidimutans]TXC62240.1 glycine--tRNA ligase subunit beta [Sphingosinicella ginsenosidimutans]
MSDFLLELLSEEIPARMQAKARADLARLFGEQLAAAGLAAQAVETYATPRRLALIARGLPAETEAVSEELKGPRTSAPPQALEGFLRKTGLERDQLVERDGIWFAVIEKPGRSTAAVLAEAIPAIVRAFPWPKSMRWGDASASTESLRWVRPLQGIVALLGGEVVPFEIAGIASGSATAGHRFHHPGAITIGSAADYVEKLRACHVIVDQDERARIVREGAAKLAAEAGLELIEDEGLIAENAGLTEWPVPLLGRFDAAFLDVPPEVIQLTARVNQKYFVCRDKAGKLANAFICTANIAASDGGAAIVEGNRKVLAARLADARFFWEQDLKVPLEEQAKKLSGIVFHEKLGTVADKVERVAKLARWLVEEGIVTSSPERGGGPAAQRTVEGALHPRDGSRDPLHHQPPAGGPPPRTGEELAALAERAARLAKADLVTGMVGEFPELQGLMGGYYAAAQGEPPEVAEAIRDHYKPVGQGDDVPTAPVTVAVSLADKLDTMLCFFAAKLPPTGSRDPFALRRSCLAAIQLITLNQLRLSLGRVFSRSSFELFLQLYKPMHAAISEIRKDYGKLDFIAETEIMAARVGEKLPDWDSVDPRGVTSDLLDFFADRLKVQQREAGVRHDLIDAVFALGGEDDLVRLLARVKALQSFVETKEGADLLAGYKRAANILKKEGWSAPTPSPQRGEGRGEGARPSSEPAGAVHPHPALSLKGEGKESEGEREGNEPLSYTPEKEEAALIAALDAAEPAAAEALKREDYQGAMKVLAGLRAPVDAFFDNVTVNDVDPHKRETRLILLSRLQHAVDAVADFSRIEG